MIAQSPSRARVARDRRTGGWVVVEQEIRDLWLSGRGTVLVFAFSILLSAFT